MPNNHEVFPLGTGDKRGVVSYLGVTALTLLLMMVFGVLMLMSQGRLISLDPQLFYKLMTAHGAGMIGLAALGGAAIMWYFVKQYLPLRTAVFHLNLALALIGVVLILTAVFAFDFSDAWTFLYPLPAVSASYYGAAGAVLFLSGLLVLGIGFLLLYAEIARGIIKQYGHLLNGLGWAQLFKGKGEYGPPPAVVAATMVVIANTVAILAGAAVIVCSLINILYPSFTIDPLLAKHLTYAFGHIFANCTIYMAVTAVYEILSRATNRPWKANKVFLIAWNFSTLFTLMIYTHHLLMDFAVPEWMLLVGQIFSYANGLPVMVVTAYGALMIVARSGIKWDMGSGFMFLAMFGWTAGAIPAIIDATIVVNHVMHNTKWVPGHFHTYMGLGVISMIIGFMYEFAKREGVKKERLLDRAALFVFLVFFLGLVGSFLYAGKTGAPRRWAEHLAPWVVSDIVGAVSAILIVLASTVFTVRFFSNFRYLWSRTPERQPARNVPPAA